jgi:hypothetical protein
MITYHLKPIKVYKYPNYGEHTDVVTQFEWNIYFSDGLSESVAGGMTKLPLPPQGAAITPIDELTDDDYFAYVMEEMGSENWANLLKFHSEECKRITTELEYEVHYDVGAEANFLYNKVLEI